jgi:hypothetical protein
MKKIGESDIFLIEKRKRRLERFWRKERRRLRARRQRLRDLKKTGYYNSRVLDLLRAASPLQPSRSNRHVAINVPKIFSIIDNPVESLKQIYLLAEAASAKSQLKEVVFDHSELQEVDLAAESLLDIAAFELRHEARSRSKTPIIHGYLPDDPRLDRYIRSIGIIKNLEVEHHFLSTEESKSLRIFRMRNKRIDSSRSISVANYQERTVVEFVDYVDDCLRDNKTKLTAESKDLLADYVGEIITNAEEHSGLGEWAIAGFLDNDNSGHFCEIAIFNFGKTISETFKELDKGSFTCNLVSPYVEKHKEKKLFSKEWSEDDLFTLISLQGGVSTKNYDEHGTRGQGTVDVIEFFQKVHSDCVGGLGSHPAKMAILSGSTHVLFDGKYKMEKNDSGRPVIAFNDSNSLEERPDRAYVKNIGEYYFPGTVISIKFPLSPSETEVAA